MQKSTNNVWYNTELHFILDEVKTKLESATKFQQFVVITVSSVTQHFFKIRNQLWNNN